MKDRVRTSPTAVIVPSRPPHVQAITVGGMTLLERAVRTLHRAGVRRIDILTECRADAALLARLTRSGIDVRITPAVEHEGGAALLVLSPDVIIEPSAVAVLADRAASRPNGEVAALEASPGTFACLSGASRRRLHGGSAADVDAAVGGLLVSSLSPVLCRRVSGRDDAIAVALEAAERRPVRGTYFHRRLHARSRSLTRVLLRLSAPVEVASVGGVVVAAAAAWMVAQGGYLLPAAGALTFLLGAAVRHSAREVRCASLADSPGRRALGTGTDAAAWLLIISGLIAADVAAACCGTGLSWIHIIALASTASAGIVAIVQSFDLAAMRRREDRPRSASAETRAGNRGPRWITWLEDPVLAYVVAMLALAGHAGSFVPVAALAGPAVVAFGGNQPGRSPCWRRRRER